MVGKKMADFPENRQIYPTIIKRSRVCLDIYNLNFDAVSSRYSHVLIVDALELTVCLLFLSLRSLQKIICMY